MLRWILARRNWDKVRVRCESLSYLEESLENKLIENGIHVLRPRRGARHLAQTKARRSVGTGGIARRPRATSITVSKPAVSQTSSVSSITVSKPAVSSRHAWVPCTLRLRYSRHCTKTYAASGSHTLRHVQGGGERHQLKILIRRRTTGGGRDVGRERERELY